MYSRRLAAYNFTIYNQASADGYCMVWNEAIGQRGANEIGTLLFIYLRGCVPRNVTSVVITSDSTVLQNRNRYITSMMLLAAQVLPNIQMLRARTYLYGGRLHAFYDRFSQEKSDNLCTV